MNYESTSHISSWIFTASQLIELRTRANNRVRSLLFKDSERKKEQQKQEEQQPNSTSTINDSSSQLPVSFAKGYNRKKLDDQAMDIDEGNNVVKETEELPFITQEEETTLVNFYATKLFDLIGPNAQHPPLRRDVKVASTAALLLRRFYLSNSVMIYDPKVFMVACAFLATKIEDATVNIKYLEEGTKLMKAHVTIPDIINSEIYLAAGCDYDLLCLHPYRAVESYTEDLRSFLRSKEGQPCVNREWVGSADLLPLYEGAKRIAEEMVVTDAPLLATPGKIGLASLHLANKRLIEEQNYKEDANKSSNTVEHEEKQKDVIKIDLKGYLKMRFGTSHKEKDIDTIWNEIDQVCTLIREPERSSQIDMVSLKGIYKKLKKCKGGNEKKKKKKKRKRVDDE